MAGGWCHSSVSLKVNSEGTVAGRWPPPPDSSSHPRQGIRREGHWLACRWIFGVPSMASWSPVTTPSLCTLQGPDLAASLLHFPAMCWDSGPGGPWESFWLVLSVHWLQSPASLAPCTHTALPCLSFCICCMSCLGHPPCHPHLPF